jgi:DNA-binding CsgD family transcriptional regulator
LQLLTEIEDHLQNITSSFVTKLTSEYVGLTPMEIQVATHVKQGKATKEIADILCLAPDTINVHRKKIRKKLGLSNKSVNLQTFLASLSEK